MGCAEVLASATSRTAQTTASAAAVAGGWLAAATILRQRGADMPKLDPKRYAKAKARALSQMQPEDTIEDGDPLAMVFSGDEIFSIPPPEYLLDDFIVKESLTLINAAPNYGKSLLALAWALSIAHDFEWSGREVHQPGPVLYLSQEGRSGFPVRAQAWRQLRHVGNLNPNFKFYPLHLDLGVTEGRPGDGWDTLHLLVSEIRPSLVIIDPFADYFTGAENSNDDVSAWATKIREEFINRYGVSVLVAAHTAKASVRGGESRGASALHGAADRVFTMDTRFKESGDTDHKVDGDPAITMLYCIKAKDGARPSPWLGKFIEMDLDEDVIPRKKNGELTTSVVVDGIDAEEFNRLDALRKYGRDTGPASVGDEVMAVVRRLGGVASLKDIKDTMVTFGTSSANTVVRRLVAEGQLAQIDRGVYGLPQADEPETL